MMPCQVLLLVLNRGVDGEPNDAMLGALLVLNRALLYQLYF